MTSAFLKNDSKKLLQVLWRAAGGLLAVCLHLLIALLHRLGPVRSSDLVGVLFRTLGPILPVSRVAQANLRLVFADRSAAWRGAVIADMWESLGRTAGELPHLADLPRDPHAGPGWDMVGGDILDALADAGGPVIFVSAHIGNWEMLPRAAALHGLPFSGIYRPGSIPQVDDILLALRRRAAGVDTPMFAKGAAGARAALAHLRGGGRLAMLVDQKMNDGIEARLFGLRAMTAPAAAAMALKYRCPVIPGHVQRLGPARLRVMVEPPLPLPDSGDRTTDIHTLTQSINDVLERWIRQQPQSWLWLHRRFPKDLVS